MSASAPAAALRSLRRAVPPTIGLLIGQVSSSFDIIYLARTHPEKNPEHAQENVSESESASIEEKFQSILNNSAPWDHAKHVTRMLPGGMFVIGIFIVYPDDIFNSTHLLAKVKQILLQINRTLVSNEYMYGVPRKSSERLIMHYSEGKVTCKSIDITANTGSVPLKSIDINFKSNMKNWQQIDCYHQFDELYPVVMKKTGMSVREQFQQILVSARQSIDASLVFLDDKLRKGTDTIDSLIKKKKVKKNAKEEEAAEFLNPIRASIFAPCQTEMPDTVEYLECEGTTHFSGIVASRIYVNIKSTFDDVTTSLKQDIIRSLASRFTMHCDALISDNLLPEENVCFNEPPRRVLIKLPELEDGNIFFCDYLFPGESPEEALTSVKEMLDANITEDNVISDIETPADTSEFDALEKNPVTEELLMTPSNAKSLFNLILIGAAIAVAIVAIIMHFAME